ncbi:MAG: ImmA/IrrE family metallo-endopeptidase [Actinomycetota bacterium]
MRRLYHRRFPDVPVPVPVDAIAEDLLGLRVVERELLGCSGMLVPWRREIRLDAAESRAAPGRRRFTLAHEIGHWICHCRRADPGEILCRAGDVDAPGDPREREANVFAAELVMPEEAVRAAHADGLSPGEIAASLDVSVEALEWRLYNLALTDEPPVSASPGG